MPWRQRPRQARTIAEGAAVAPGARGVPFTVLGNRLGIPGAVSAGQHTAAISQAWEQVNG